MAKKYEKYKSSGVEWIGEIPEHWEIRKLKYLAKTNPTKGSSKFTKFSKEWVSFLPMENISVNGVVDYSLQKNIKDVWDGFTFFAKGDIVIAKITPCFENGKGALLDGMPTEIGFGTTEFHVVRCSKELNRKLFYYISSTGYFRKQGVIHMTGSAGQQRVPLAFISSYEIPVIPLQEQQKIASYLDKKSEEIDRFIKNKENLISLLEEEKKATITKAVTKGLDSNVRLKSSGADWLGEIPEHWETYRTKYLFSLIAKPSGRKHDLELLSIYTAIGVKPRQELEEKGNKASSTDGYWLVKKRDFIVNKLLAWMGAIGLSEYDGVTSPAYDILRKNRNLDEYFYNYLFRCGVLFEEIKKYSKGIMEMRLRLYFTEFGKIFLPYPSFEEQQAIVAYLDEETKKIDDLKAKYQQEIDLIKEYKERLIYDVVTGKMSVLEH